MAEVEKIEVEIPAEQPNQSSFMSETPPDATPEAPPENTQPETSSSDPSPSSTPPSVDATPSKEQESSSEPKAPDKPVMQEAITQPSESRSPESVRQQSVLSSRISPEVRNLQHQASTRKREARLTKILELARQKGNASNRDIRKRLGISEATATRYATELIRRGHLRKSGRTKAAKYEAM